MITLRRSAERGHAVSDWLDTRHTFSFADYHDPQQMGFRSLRVINEDIIAAGQGFGTHSHRDMEIITYVLEGELRHEDSMGNGSTISPGEIQRMTAGSGILHSEVNPSPDRPVHLLQIWIRPGQHGLEPGYEQRAIAVPEGGGWVSLASPRPASGGLLINQEVELLAARMTAGQRLERSLAPGRGAWLQVVRGVTRLGDHLLQAGDGAALTAIPEFALEAHTPSEVLLFDLE